MTETTHIITVAPDEAGERLDKFLAARLPEFSRSRLQGLAESGHIQCDGKVVDAVSAKTKAGQRYSIFVPEVAPSHIVAQDIALDIVFEDEHMLVLNKPLALPSTLPPATRT